NLYQFKNMIQCTTKRSVLEFMEYGCYC
nr:RecName: Full=Phospholipase A2 1; Short=svPLA2; AltName: Full=Phosphatidylcholine 2-acylhydrolase [Micrurus nigrocinctus]